VSGTVKSLFISPEYSEGLIFNAMFRSEAEEKIRFFASFFLKKKSEMKVLVFT